jgi:hypothetical protein
MIEPTSTVRLYLRRYKADSTCDASGYDYHNAQQPFLDMERPEGEPELSRPFHGELDPLLWPRACACGYVFTPADPRQLNEERLYVRTASSETFTLADAPPGAIYRAPWMEDTPAWTGVDGHCLVVVLPNGNPWMIDGPANNCTNLEDFLSGGHKCWIRHNAAPVLTVDKNGRTCAAGAGSIKSGNCHCFLIGGEFFNC